MMGWSPGCYIPSFVEIGSPVLVKKIFEGFFTVYGRGGHLGHVTKISQTKFQCHYPGRLQAVSEKKIFEIVDDDDDGRRRRTDGRRIMGIL